MGTDYYCALKQVLVRQGMCSAAVTACKLVTNHV